MIRKGFNPDFSLTAAMLDRDLFGRTFNRRSFWTWRTFGKVIDGLSLTEAREIELYRECTGGPNCRAGRCAGLFVWPEDEPEKIGSFPRSRCGGVSPLTGKSTSRPVRPPRAFSLEGTGGKLQFLPSIAGA